MKTILTSKDIENILKEGIKEVVVSDELIITSIARDTGEKEGLKFINGIDKARVNDIQDITKVDESSVDILIKNGNLVIPGVGIIKGNISICKDKIISISASNKVYAQTTIDAEGKYVIPGIIDPHVHLGIFDSIDKEMSSELTSALVGGVTTVGLFLGGEDSHLPKIKHIKKLLDSSSEADIFLHACIMNKAQLEEIDEYIANGIKSFKFYMCGIPGIIEEASDDFLLEAFSKLSKREGTMAVVHAENASAVKWATEKISLSGIKNLKEWSYTHPSWAEEEAIQRAALFAKIMEIPIYFVHISSKEGLEAIRTAQKCTEKVFAETTSPYLTLNCNMNHLGTFGKMSPPIRSLEDSDALWKGCTDGTINTLGTDNTTITKAEKKISSGMEEAIPGYPTLETHLSSLINEGVYKRGVDFVKLVELISMNPAKIFGLFPKKGTLMPGSDADIVILDIQEEKIVSPQKLHSRSDFSLFQEMKLKGWPVVTIKSGKIIAEGGYYLGDNKGGKVILR